MRLYSLLSLSLSVSLSDVMISQLPALLSCPTSVPVIVDPPPRNRKPN